MTAIDPLSCAIVIIGAELLCGAVHDQNTIFLLRKLYSRGLNTQEVRMICDDIDAIASTIAELRQRYMYIFTTGGIGPTHDDVTFLAVAKGLQRDVASHEILRQWFAKRSAKPLGAAEHKMTLLPVGSHVLMDAQEQAIAIGCENIWILPGVPHYMRQSFALLADRLPQATIYERTIWLHCGEVPIAEILQQGQTIFPSVQIGSYPQTEGVGPSTKVTLQGRDACGVEQCYQWLLQALPAQHVRPFDQDLPS